MDVAMAFVDQTTVATKELQQNQLQKVICVSWSLQQWCKAQTPPLRKTSRIASGGVTQHGHGKKHQGAGRAE